MLPFFRLMCGPALTSLSAEFATDPTSLATVAALGVLADTLSDDLASALSTSICCWKDLTHVSCDDLTVSALDHFCQTRNLESFTACASPHLSSFSQTLSAHRVYFPRLQRLHLYTGLLSTTTACLRVPRLSLEEFRLGVFDAGELFSDASCLRDYFTALSHACSHSHLAHLYLCAIRPHLPPRGSESSATIRDLRPLFSFTRLRVLSLDGLLTLTLDDDALAELGAAWPDAERLTLTTYVDPGAPLPTFGALARLLRACPKLAALSLVVDATSSPASGTRAEALRDLCLGNAPLGSPRASRAPCTPSVPRCPRST